MVNALALLLRPWVIGYSGGKDSTTVVELVYKMLMQLDVGERKKDVYIVSSDTMIENPLIKIYLSKMNEMLGEAAKRDNIPLHTCMVTPPANNTFWANVIGRGFPTPRMNGTFRWYTDRLKINPSGVFIFSPPPHDAFFYLVPFESSSVILFALSFM